MKKVFVLVSGLVALLMVATLGYVLTFDPNENKTWIATKFRESTGRELTLGGDIGLTLYPWLGLSVNELAIGNAPGFSDTPLLRAGQAQMRIKLLPLLGGSYEIDTVRLQDTHINLEVLGDGRSNWADLAGDAATEDSSSDGSATAMLSKVIIGGVDITNLSLVYDDQFANSHYEIRNLNMAIGELVYGAPLDIGLTLEFASRTPRLDADLTVNGTVIYDVDAERYTLDPLAISAILTGANVPGGSANLTLGTALHADLAADTVSLRDFVVEALGSRLQAGLELRRVQSDTPGVSGTLNLAGNDLAVFFRILEQQELAQRISSLDNRFDIQTSLDLDMQSGVLSVPTLQVALLGAEIRGNLNGTRINTDTPQFSGRLNAQGPDLPLLMQIAGQVQGGRESALNTLGGQLRTGVRDRAFTLSTDFDADLQRGDIRLPMLDAALLGFTLNGNLDARNMQGSDGSIDGALTLQGDNLREVLAATGQADLAAVAQSLNLDLRVSGSSSNLRLSPFNLNLVLAGQQIPNSPQTLALNADTVMNLDNDSLRIDTFSLTGLGLNLNGNVTASNVSSDPSFEGQLALPAFNARRLLQQLNQPEPATSDATVLQRVALSTAFKGTANSLNLDNLALTLDDSSINGSMAVNDFVSGAARFSVTVDSIDADRYLAPAAEESSPRAASEPEPLPVDTLRALDVQGSLNIGTLGISGLALRDIVVEMTAADGELALNPVSANLYDGNFTGDIRLNVTGAEPQAVVNTTLSTINLEPLLQDFMDATYLTGTGNIQLALSGSGADSAAIKRSLGGSGSIALEDGVLTGVDVAAVLQRIETMIRSRRLEQLPQGGETPFDNFSATLAIDQGVVSSNDLLIRAPGWQVVGSGTLADLGSETLNFNLVTSVDPATATRGDQEYDLGGYTLPIACTGNISSPRCLPDAQQIIAAAVGNAVQQRLGEFLQDRLGGGQPAQPPVQDAAPDSEADPLQEQQTPQQEPAQEPEQDPAEQLLNRALDRLLR